MELPSLYVNPALKKAPATQLRRQKRHLLWPGTPEHSRKKLETPVIGGTQKGNRNPNPNLKNIEFCFVGLFFFLVFIIWRVGEPCYRVFGVPNFITCWQQKQRNLKVPIWVTGTESKHKMDVNPLPRCLMKGRVTTVVRHIYACSVLFHQQELKIIRLLYKRGILSLVKCW